MKWLFKSLLFLMLSTSSFLSLAETTELQVVHKGVQKFLPNVPVEAIQVSPIPGLYQVMVPPKLFYVSADGRYVLDGDMIDMKAKKNVSDPLRDELRISAIDSLGENNMIIYGPKVAKHTVTVFTDIDCGYCRKLHNEMDKYNKAGIRVRYLAYPRAGLGSESYNKAVSVWCADDRNKAMTDAKQGAAMSQKTCQNPVAAEYELGQMIGIRGTPAIVTDKGQMIPGYVPADRLQHILNTPLAQK